MTESPNTQIIAFLKTLPEAVLENTILLCAVLARPELVEKMGDPNVNWIETGLAMIDPEPGKNSMEQHGAAAVWAGLLDHHFGDRDRATTAEMLEWIEKEEQRTGKSLDNMRVTAEGQDSRNAEFSSAADEWKRLRASELAPNRISRFFFKKAAFSAQGQ